MFSVSISLGNLFTAPLLSSLSPSLLSSSTLESILPPAHCNAAAVIAPNRLLWLEEPREGQKEGKQDEKLISGRLKPPPHRRPRFSLVSVAQGRRSETRSHKSGLWELPLLAMLPECTETTHLFDRKWTAAALVQPKRSICWAKWGRALLSRRSEEGGRFFGSRFDPPPSPAQSSWERADSNVKLTADDIYS